MNTPQKMTDLRHVNTELTAEERLQARNEGKRQKWLAALGPKWLGHPQYSGTYKPELHARIAR
jgi:hypothetical protein